MANQWDDEDKPDLNIEKESWEDEDKPDPTPNPTPKPNPPAKKKKSQMRKDQLKAAEDDKVVPLSNEEKLRRREMEEKADFEHTKSLLGLEGEEEHGKKGRTDLELSDLSVVVPVKAEPVAVDLSSLSLKSSAGSEKEFDQIAQQVAGKLTGFSNNTHYPYLVKALLKQLMHAMDAEEVREVGKSVDLIYNEKVKQRKGGKVTKKGNVDRLAARQAILTRVTATTAKKAVNLGRESLANDEEEFDEASDFM